MNVGSRIKELRLAKGYSVNGLAYRCGVSQSYIRDLELGNKKSPSVDIVELICDALGISLLDFFDDNTQKNFAESHLLKTIYSLSPQQQLQLDAFLSSMLQ